MSLIEWGQTEFEVRMLCKLFIKGGQGKRDIRIVN